MRMRLAAVKIDFYFFGHGTHKWSRQSHDDVLEKNQADNDDDKSANKVADCAKGLFAPIPNPDFGDEISNAIGKPISRTKNNNCGYKADSHGYSKIFPEFELGN